MKIWKRVLAFLCAALLIFNLALYPLRARATAGVLVAAGAAITVSAFLMACGIYPYVEDGQSFGEWGAESLYDLWGQYVSSFEDGQLPSGGTVETFNQIKSFVVGNTLAIASGTWEMLRGFASWIVEKFKVQDNQTGVQLGVTITGRYEVPIISSASISDLRNQGVYIFKQGTTKYNLGSLDSGYYMAYVYVSGSTSVYALRVFTRNTSNVNVVYLANLSNSYVDDVTIVRDYGKDYSYGQVSTSAMSTYVLDLPIYDTNDEAVAAIFGAEATFSGILADTTTITPLEPLPADTPWGGLSVGTSNPVGTVEQGVTDRTKPVVRPVEVEIGSGTDVDSETGEITENPVVITPEDVVPTVAALSPPASFLSALQTAVMTKFPFCLPFDLFKILQAFYVTPEAPVFSLSFHDPFSNSDFSITVDLSPWDEVAAVVRNFEAMILLAGFCLNFDKFNVIHLILGGLG